MAVALAKAGIARIRPHMIGAAPGPMPPATILLNSNESAYGPSPLAAAAARAAVTGLARYAEDPDAQLAPVIAARFGLDGRRITTGNGSDDLLARLARGYLGPGTELLRTANGYLKTPNYAHANDADVVSVPDDDFRPSVERMIGAISERTRIVYLANPENPAGTCLSGAEIRRLHAAMPTSALLVIDAAYEEYVDDPEHEPAHRLVDEASNVVMCRTFSKIYGLAGARIGWLYGPDDVVDTVRRISLTFPLAAPSVAAAIAAIEDREHEAFVRARNSSDRGRLAADLTDMGLQVIPSQANFLLVRFPDPARSAAAADAYLRGRGIAIRRFASPAFADCLRITIGTTAEIDAATAALRGYLIGDG